MWQGLKRQQVVFCVGIRPTPRAAGPAAAGLDPTRYHMHYKTVRPSVRLLCECFPSFPSSLLLMARDHTICGNNAQSNSLLDGLVSSFLQEITQERERPNSAVKMADRMRESVAEGRDKDWSAVRTLAHS